MITERRDYSVMVIEMAKVDNTAKALETAGASVRTSKVKELMEPIQGKLKDAKNGLEAARMVEKSGIGKDLMDAVRDKVRAIQANERGLLATRQQESQASVQTTSLSILLGTVLAFIVVGLSGFLIVRSINMTVRDGVSKFTSASAEILAGSTQQAAGAQEQAAAVAQTVTTVDEVTQTADQSAQRAKSVGEGVQRTLEIGKTGRKVVEDSLQAMAQVQREGGGDGREHPDAGRAGPGHRRHHRHGERHRRADQPTGPERRH